ncbi:MAG: prephenate dehydratase [Chloroflexi bacterium]|nr:prephenate dehydratase [Chloroflexota bacterium]
MKVAYQGEPGAYSEEAGYGYFDAPEMIPQETFDDVFAVVTAGTCQSGLIPIENSLAGSIHQNYDLLLRHELYIVGEYFLPVRHCLIGFPQVELSGIKHVISHPQALGQCSGYLRELGVKTEPVYDTAGSVKILKSSGDHTMAAIASKKAAEIYEMGVLQENIEDNPENYTRFLEIKSMPVKSDSNAKTSIVFTLKNQPGALYKALSVFALNDIDLTKIESRPLAGKPWEYLFYMDFICTGGNESGQLALDQLGEYALMLRVLGSYPRFRS